MYPLKQSTGLTIPFFAHDVDGDGVTGITDVNFTKLISKNGGVFGAMTVTITEMESGWYSLPIGTGHSDTVGILTISLSAAACKRVNLQFRVGVNLIDDISSRIPAALVSGRMSSDAVAISGSSDAADKLEASAETIVPAAAVAGTLSTTEMTTDLTETTDSHYNGRIILWKTGVLKDQATDITAYNGTTKMLTFTAVTEAPSDGDTFVIV